MQSPSRGGDGLEERPGRSMALPTGVALVVGIMLAVDELNPIKVLCGYTHMESCNGYMACAMTVCLGFVLINHTSRIYYYSTKLFLRTWLNRIFFKVEIVGMENLPVDGPVILTGNHNNQFVDGAILLTNCSRQVSFMIAEKSWRRPVVGFLARAFRCIPVARPQDSAVKGSGILLMDGTATVTGEGTRFSSQVTPGSQLVISGREKPLKIKQVLSNTQLVCEVDVAANEGKKGARYEILPKVDQSAMYDAVFKCLGSGHCLGIFPEGGSHDRTDLLPLKAGVAIIALDAFTKHKIRVPIVPVGLNYFHGGSFRGDEIGGRVVVEYGLPIHIDDHIYSQFENDRHGATNALLQIVTTSMKSVVVPAPDYQTLRIVYMARRLYVKEGIKLSAEQTNDLDRRFAEAIRRLRATRQSIWSDEAERDTSPSGTTTDADASAAEVEDRTADKELISQLDELGKDLLEYMKALKRLGLRDHQVVQLQWWSFSDLLARLLYLTALLGLSAIAQLLFTVPVGLVARKFAAREQKKALKASSVKLAARDVVMSYTIICVLVLVPCLYVTYVAMLCVFSGLSWTSIALAMLACPFCSFVGVKAGEQGIRAYADIVPLLMRCLPNTRKQMEALPAQRASLQARVRRSVRTCGPWLGDIYTQKDVDWSQETNRDVRSIARSSSFPELKKSQ